MKLSHYPNLSHFFTTTIGQFLIPDLERLRHEVRPRGLYEGCAIATAMLVFPLMDLVGFLMRPAKSAKKNETKVNITFFLSQEAGLLPPHYSTAAPILVKLFRHGIMHQIFPKSCGLSKPHPLLSLPLLFTVDSFPILNVDALVDDVLHAITLLKKKASSDEALASRMEERLVRIKKEDAEIFASLKVDIEKLYCCPAANVTFTTSP